MNISKKCDYESDSTLKIIAPTIKYLAYREPINPETERHPLAPHRLRGSRTAHLRT